MLTHTLNLETAFDLNSRQFSYDTYLRTPLWTDRQTDTHTGQRNPKATKLFAFISSRLIKGRQRKTGEGEKQEKRRVNEERAALKSDTKEKLLLWLREVEKAYHNFISFYPTVSFCYTCSLVNLSVCLAIYLSIYTVSRHG